MGLHRQPWNVVLNEEEWNMRKGAESGYATDEYQLEKKAVNLNPGFQWDPVVAKAAPKAGHLLHRDEEKWRANG